MRELVAFVNIIIIITVIRIQIICHLKKGFHLNLSIPSLCFLAQQTLSS